MRLLIDTSFQFLLCSVISIAATVAFGATVNTDKCVSYKNLFEQISCYAAAAKSINDLAPCDQATQEGVRYQCYAIFAEFSASSDICRKIPAKTNEHRSLIDGCLSDVALKAHDPSLCEGIVIVGLRDSCYFKLAKELGERALCAKIQDKGLKSGCTGEPVIVK